MIQRYWPAVRRNLDLGLLGLVLLCTLVLPGVWPLRLLLPGGAPPGIIAAGAFSGAGFAMQAMGMVLVLRATRVINFGQAQLGALSGLLFFELTSHNQLAIWGVSVCSGCFSHIPSDTAYMQTHPDVFYRLLHQNGYDGWITANFWLSLVAALVVAPAISWLVYMLVVRRFDHAPRLLVTVVTVGVAQLLVALSNLVPNLFFRDATFVPTQLHLPLPALPVDFGFRLPWQAGRVQEIQTLPQYGTLVVALVVGLAFAAFFKWTRVGIAMRSIADNQRRAQMLGIPVASMASVSWLLAGALSGLAAVMATMAGGIGSLYANNASTFSVSALTTILAAVAFARFAGLAVSLFASIGLGALSQVLVWNFNTPVWFDVALLVLIGAALLLQQSRQSRAEQEANAGYLAAREARPIPAELRHVPVVDSWLRGLFLLLAAAAVIFPFIADPAQLSLGAVLMIFSIAGLSLLVLVGWAGQVSLGQWSIAAVGAYVTAVLAAHAGLWFLLAIAVGAVAGAGVSVLVGIPALRLRGLYLAVTTMAFALVATDVVLGQSYLGRFLPSSLNRPDFLGVSLEDDHVYYFVCAGFLCLAAMAVLGLRRSRTGRALIAARDNEQQAQSFSYSLFWGRLEAFAFSGFLAGLAGGLFAFQQHGVQPAAFTPEQSISLFLFTVIGGLGSIAGPLVGAAYQGLFTLFNNPVLAILGTGAGVLLVLMLAPGGLASVLYSMRDGMLRRVAIRHRIVVASLLADVKEGGLDAVADIAPKRAAGGGAAFVPVRYRLGRQWDRINQGLGRG